MTDSPQSSSEHSPRRLAQAVDLLHPTIQLWLRGKDWQKLGALQEEAIRAILSEPEEDLRLSDPSGESTTIEAVYMALLTRLARFAKEATGFHVLHVAPRQILVDQRFEIIEKIARLVDIPVARLHDEVSCADKARALKSPAGILLATPEALEVFVVIRTRQLPVLFRHLQYLIVEESDSVVPPERARKLQSALDHINLAINRSPRKIGLTR